MDDVKLNQKAWHKFTVPGYDNLPLAMRLYDEHCLNDAMTTIRNLFTA